jgi:hypothetical protein
MIKPHEGLAKVDIARPVNGQGLGHYRARGREAGQPNSLIETELKGGRNDA